MKTPDLQILTVNTLALKPLPLMVERIQAGFPSPAQSAVPDTIDLAAELVNDPANTFCARVIGSSMTGQGIEPGDLLIIDRSIQPHDGCVAVCSIDGDFTVKTLKVTPDGIFLQPANKRFKPIHVSEFNDFVIWGVVSHIIHQL